MGRGETLGVPESRNAGGLERGRTQCELAKVKGSWGPLSSRRGPGGGARGHQGCALLQSRV